MDAQPKPDEEKKTPEVKREDVDFFDEYPIYINMDEYNSKKPEEEPIDSFYVFMRPLIVEELQILNRVIYLQEKEEDNEQASFLMINLMVDTLDVEADEVPVEATSGLIAKMIEYNFPQDMTQNNTEKKEEKPKKEKKDGLIECFDFLVAHGHNYSEILKYPIPVFNNFIVVIAERLGIKDKPMDAGAAFRKLGLPIKKRGNK